MPPSASSSAKCGGLLADYVVTIDVDYAGGCGDAQLSSSSGTSWGTAPRCGPGSAPRGSPRDGRSIFAARG